ncbi:ATP-grasp domain-containing protein [Actinoplanes sp. NPDC051494]|uniref:ATP-grasp domain-containing protein n=1 Tax=Actinoplanes sp. NPDC051494 TaxID=3363907 RepID=UPI0037A5D52B
MLLLVPGDALRPRRPDEHFAAEAAAAREAGHEVAIVDHDALATDRDPAAAVARVPAATDAVYRGWMLSSARYAAMATALAARDVTLRTGAEEYRRAHELPGWYPVMSPVTPATAWAEGDDRAAFDRAAAAFTSASGPAATVLRDYTKSVKHYWAEAAYIPDILDRDAAWRVASRMRELRDDDFAGGFVLRRFEDFAGAEARTWWVGGECRLVTAHPDTPGEPPAPDLDLTGVAALIPRLGLPFVTADLVRHRDGRWRVVEVGDGQVSDRPASTPAADLIAVLG